MTRDNMISLRVFIPGQIIDSYIYAGHLFGIFADGTLRVLPLENLLENLQDDWTNLLRFAVIRNDWLLNEQALAYYDLPCQLTPLIETWESNRDIPIVIPNQNWNVICELSSMPVYDIHGYARRIFWTNRDGVFEKDLDNVFYSDNEPSNKAEKIFDARTIFITAKSGELMLSADDEGLFHATLWTEDGKTYVEQKQYASKSLRTGWSQFDLLNYETNSTFTYYVNQIIREEKRPFHYSEMDEMPEKRHIEQIGVSMKQPEEMNLPESLSLDHVAYCFNSKSSTFWFMESGEFYRVNFRKDPNKPINLSSNAYKILGFPIKDELPYSACLFAYGTVIEFFDKVVLVRNNQISMLEEKPAISVRTFPTSRRYKRLICITREDGIALHSIFPSDKEISEMRKKIRNRSKFDF